MKTPTRRFGKLLLESRPLSITHMIEREPSKLIEAVSGGSPKVISNLKSLVETGSAVLQDAYSMRSQA